MDSINPQTIHSSCGLARTLLADCARASRKRDSQPPELPGAKKRPRKPEMTAAGQAKAKGAAKAKAKAKSNMDVWGLFGMGKPVPMCPAIRNAATQFRALGLIKPMIMATLEKILRSKVCASLDVSFALEFDMLLLLL